MADMKSGFTGIRRAIIESISGDGSFGIYYADDNSNNVIKGVQSINSGSFGSGVFTQYHIGAQVWVGQSFYYQPIILGFFLPLGSIESGDILATDDIDNPTVDSGEVVIQASSGAHMDFRNTGDIKISNLHNDGVYLSDAHRSLSLNAYQYYNLNDSGYTIQGRVRRFNPTYTPGTNPVFVDLIIDPEADSFTTDISRDPTQKALPMNRARGMSNVIRNPAFAEKREMILEFADSFFVRDALTETELAQEFPQTLSQMDKSIAKRRGYGTNEQNFDNLRYSSRTNLLKMDSNVIIERVEGTLVDIFGNVLDLNYNKLPLPQLTNTGKAGIQQAHDMLNRSVAYHFQLNSRNTTSQTPKGTNKFNLDIDKEGQFKLNVPRSSNSGTTPTLSIFTDTSDIGSRTDIINTQLSQSSIAAPTGGNAGTAYHDMTLVADRLIRHSIQTINPIREFGNTSGVLVNGDTPNIEYIVNSSILTSSAPTYTTTISVAEEEPAISSEIDPLHSGGRSGQLNLEGSMELSIGADEVDGKSIMLDTDGSMVSWFGMDDNGRSIITNADGSVLLNIGGGQTQDQNGKDILQKGSLEIRVNLIDESVVGEGQAGEVRDNKKTSDHIITITPQGIVISSGNGTPVIVRSSGDMMFEAAGRMSLKAKEMLVSAGGYARKISAKKGDI